MPDFRAYAPDTPAEAAEIRLSADESRHLVAVNRCGHGDPVVAFDGRGREWQCECVDAAKTGARLRVRSMRVAEPLPQAITLAQALPKGAVMDEIVRQATEIGAVRIVPLVTERTQVHLDNDRSGKKLAKWRTAAIEAAKQCGNPRVPAVDPLQGFGAFAEAAKDFDLKLVASLHGGARSLKAVVAHYRAQHAGAVPRSVLWLVGPEGDFSPAEITAAVLAGFAPVTLGPLVLRCDTAACYALSVTMHELAE